MAWFDDIKPSVLTFVAEAIGQNESIPKPEIRTLLVPLLSHASAIVREGALYGLAESLNRDTILLIDEISRNDPVKSVRNIATDTLGSLGLY